MSQYVVVHKVKENEVIFEYLISSVQSVVFPSYIPVIKIYTVFRITTIQMSDSWKLKFTGYNKLVEKIAGQSSQLLHYLK